ncbi:uncharacterized protein LOC143464594 [Clavelina lepadiformis]|uniref:uncharacterized protein LOC143464594 n=1 Tax=Clavelina lepadiformis TaxID=159417 RepID=UPI004042056F
MEENSEKKNGSSKYKDILKRAKESRNKLEKSFNSSQDRSFTASGIHKKKRHPKDVLSQSFVMRQASALSTKNKQLAFALAQRHKQVSELEEAMGIAQRNMMTMGINLNSREVALDATLLELRKTKEELIRKDERYQSLRSKLEELKPKLKELYDEPEENISATRNTSQSSSSSLEFSFQPRRVASSKITTRRNHSSKWHPDLTIVQETSLNHSDLEESLSNCTTPSSLNSTIYPDESEKSPLSNITLQTWINMTENDVAPVKRKKRRTSLFSDCSFDPDSFNLNDLPLEEDEEAENIKETVNSLADCGDGCEEEPQKLTKQKIAHSDKSTNQLEQENVEIVTKKPLKNSQHPTSSDESSLDKTDLSVISMELTQPIESSIFTGKKASKKVRFKNKPKKAVAKKIKTQKEGKSNKENTARKLNTVESEYFNFSSDSFITNPEKRIKLSNSANVVLPMADVTNNLQETVGGRVKRRTTPVSYVEPKLNRKLRRGDKNSDVTFCRSLSPKHGRKPKKLME